MITPDRNRKSITPTTAKVATTAVSTRLPIPLASPNAWKKALMPPRNTPWANA